MIKQGGRTGYWSPYNNSADPQNQTPTKPAAAMADKIAVEPGGVCMNNAFHSSATGQDNYVGFVGEVPPEHAADDVRPRRSVRRQQVGRHHLPREDRRRRRPRSRCSSRSSRRRRSRRTAGGTATSQAVDLYNNRGFMVTIASTTYQQFFVPFGALIPRSLPAAGSGGNACPTGSNPKCQAPKFVPANALAIQFSWYGPMDTPGFLTPSPVGSYNVLVDDVAFYKRSALPSGMSDLPALPNSGGMHPLTDNPTINSRCSEAGGREPQAAGAGVRQLEEALRRRGQRRLQGHPPGERQRHRLRGHRVRHADRRLLRRQGAVRRPLQVLDQPRRHERSDDLVHPRRRRQLLRLGRYRDRRRRGCGVRDADGVEAVAERRLLRERPRR